MTKENKREAGNQPRTLSPWVPVVVGLLLLAGFGFALFKAVIPPRQPLPTPRAKEATVEASQETVRALRGRWVRADGGYVLEILNLLPGGRLEAAYFNPRPIRVGSAEWRMEGGRPAVFVELRDVNYPGSRYALTLDAEGKLLEGNYFQATEQKTYDVVFEREP